MTHERPLSPAPDERDDGLDQVLRAEGLVHRADYLADDGFTARVMAKLPPVLTLPAWRKPALTALWGIAAVGVAAAFPGAYADALREGFRLVAGHPVSLSQIATGIVLLGIGSWTATAWLLRRD